MLPMRKSKPRLFRTTNRSGRLTPIKRVQSRCNSYVEGGRVFALGANGHVHCLDAAAIPYRFVPIRGN